MTAVTLIENTDLAAQAKRLIEFKLFDPDS